MLYKMTIVWLAKGAHQSRSRVLNEEGIVGISSWVGLTRHTGRQTARAMKWVRGGSRG